MPTIGEILKAAREAGGFSLEEVAEATRVQLRFLKSLEEGNLGTMPDESYFLGFLSSYASFLGLNAGELCQQFLTHYRRSYLQKKTLPETKTSDTAAPGVAPEKTSSAPVSPPAPEKSSTLEKSPPTPVSITPQEQETKVVPPAKLEKKFPLVPLPAILSSRPASRTSRRLGLYFLMALMVLAGIYFFTPLLKKSALKDEKAAPTAPAVQTPPASLPQTPTSPPAPSPPPTPLAAKKISSPPPSPALTPVAAVKPPPAPAPSPLRLEARASQDCWVAVRIDGAPQRVEFLVKKGQQVSWEAKERFTVTLGNAGGVELFLNGKSLGPLGQQRQVVDMDLTNEGRK
jgi:cytoskeleton protein RodZ